MSGIGLVLLTFEPADEAEYDPGMESMIVLDPLSVAVVIVGLLSCARLLLKAPVDGPYISSSSGRASKLVDDGAPNAAALRSIPDDPG